MNNKRRTELLLAIRDEIVSYRALISRAPKSPDIPTLVDEKALELFFATLRKLNEAYTVLLNIGKPTQ